MKRVEMIYYSDLIEKCGEPGDNLVKRQFPFTLYLMGDKSQPCKTFVGHKRIADAVIEVFDDILDYYGIEYIRKNGLDNYGGCFSIRKAIGFSKISTHSWGMAVDYLPQMGPLKGPNIIPYKIVEMFRAHGFQWGGIWPREDGMHFTAVIE